MLFTFYPELKTGYTMLHRHIYTENMPGKPDRLGDSIVVVGGDDFMKKLEAIPEGFVFHMNSNWKFTIRGGKRSGNMTKEELDMAAASAAISEEMSAKITRAFANEAAQAAGALGPDQ